MEDLKIEYVPIGSIKPYGKNAKLHPQEQIAQIKESIKQFGNCDPIGIWNGEVVEGHGRLMALKEMGADTVPVIRLDHLTDEQRRAYALVHNKLTMNSPFDDGILSEELDNILDIDMSMFDLGDVLLSEPNMTELDDETTKENIILTINIQNVDDFETLKSEIENLIEGKNITMAVKMS